MCPCGSARIHQIYRVNWHTLLRARGPVGGYINALSMHGFSQAKRVRMIVNRVTKWNLYDMFDEGRVSGCTPF